MVWPDGRSNRRCVSTHAASNLHGSLNYGIYGSRLPVWVSSYVDKSVLFRAVGRRSPSCRSPSCRSPSCRSRVFFFLRLARSAFDRFHAQISRRRFSPAVVIARMSVLDAETHLAVFARDLDQLFPLALLVTAPVYWTEVKFFRCVHVSIRRSVHPSVILSLKTSKICKRILIWGHRKTSNPSHPLLHL